MAIQEIAAEGRYRYEKEVVGNTNHKADCLVYYLTLWTIGRKLLCVPCANQSSNNKGYYEHKRSHAVCHDNAQIIGKVVKQHPSWYEVP